VFLFFVYNFSAFLALHLPEPAARTLARVTSALFYLVTPGMKRNARRNFRVMLSSGGREPTAGELERLVWRAYLNFGLYLYEFFLIPRIDGEFLNRRLEVRGLEHLDSAIGGGRGVISITGHLGNWELAGILTSMMGYPVTAVALDHRSPSMNKFFLHRRRMKGVKIVAVGGRTLALIRALKKSGIVALLADRVFSRSRLRMDFFGRSTYLPAGPAELAVLTGSPIVPGFLVRRGRRYLLSFEPPIHPDLASGRSSAVRTLARHVIDVLERYIRTYPEQWLVFEYLWNKETAF